MVSRFLTMLFPLHSCGSRIYCFVTEFIHTVACLNCLPFSVNVKRTGPSKLNCRACALHIYRVLWVILVGFSWQLCKACQNLFYICFKFAVVVVVIASIKVPDVVSAT